MKKISAAFIILVLSLNVMAESAEEKGMAIAVEADTRDTGWGDQKTSMEMILRNRHGDKSTREMHNKSLEVTGDGDKTLIVFDRPRDVKGTAFLSFTHAIKPDDQWIYLPALKRVKRISSSNKSGPFMGSEFAYEDISSQEIEKYTYKYIKDDVYEGRSVFVIERFPQYKNSGYTRMISWLDSETYSPLKIDFYDRKNSLLKTLTYHDYKQYLDKFWRADRMEMVNHLTGKSTTLIWSEYKFANGLSDRDFNKNSLKRAR
ncbi:Outer membrane lipoprotein-sorting protein [hydrothermal vent metagenome]|uniref:Outer membrane lipoprotein-sorting protein n=1 Tax=hydrothermal vent metagenome TaxID=652676 RepID=A0A3B1AVU0_9ZZZZ